jgi:hypothetical protein
MGPLSYWICANGVTHSGACNCVTRPPKWIARLIGRRS